MTEGEACTVSGLAWQGTAVTREISGLYLTASTYFSRTAVASTTPTPPRTLLLYKAFTPGDETPNAVKKIRVISYRLVFDGGTGHTQVQLALFFNACVNQGLHRALLLEQKECVACKSKRREGLDWIGLDSFQCSVTSSSSTATMVISDNAPLGGK